MEYLKKVKIDQYKRSHKYIFDHVVEKSRLATNSDYYVPKSIANKCIIYDFQFDRVGCTKIACFPYKEKGSLCGETAVTEVVRYGSAYTFACQPACRLLYGGGTVLDTIFENNKCMAANHFLKYYALNPYSRIEGLSTLDVKDDKLALNEEYCQRHGLVFDAKQLECTTTPSQYVGEIFVGSTIYRSLNVLQAQTKISSPPPPPQIPPELGGATPFLGAGPPPPPPLEFHLPDDEDYEYPSHILTEIAKNLAIDQGVSLTTGRIAHFLRRKVPVHLVKGTHPVALAAILKNTVGKIFSAGTATLNLLSLATMFTDMMDPAGFNKLLTKAQLSRITANCKREFLATYGGEDFNVTPEFLIEILEMDSLESEGTINLINDRAVEYLNALDTNSAGQRLDIQKKHLETIISKLQRNAKPQIIIIIHYGITLLFLFLALFSSRLLPYVIVAYIYYVIAYSIYTNNS